MDDSANDPVKSITDLARIAGVSVSTISRALTGKGALNKHTAKRSRHWPTRMGFA